MNRKLPILFTVWILLVIFCAPFTPTPVPARINQALVDGDSGRSSLPVQCDQAQGDVSIPHSSFSGKQTITIECLSQSEQAQLDQAVEIHTGSTGEVLGAIKLSPSGLKFNSDVIITIPLIRQVTAQYVDVYIYSETSSSMFDEVVQAKVDCTGWCAKASVDHFTTFVAYEAHGPGDLEGPQITNYDRQPDSNWVCLEEIDGVAVRGTITDSSGVESAVVEYRLNNGNPKTLDMQPDGQAFTATIKDLQEGALDFKISATDRRGNSSTVEGRSLSLFQCAGLAPHTDLPGLDFPNTGASVGTNNLQACRQQCVDNPECMAFTYMPADGTCRLKRGEPQPVDNPDLISGVVRPDQAPPEISDIQASPPGGTACLQDYKNQFNLLSTIRDPSGVSRANLISRFNPFPQAYPTPFVENNAQASISMQQAGDIFNASMKISGPGKLSYSIEAWDIHDHRLQTDEAQITYWDCDKLLLNTNLVGLDFPNTGTLIGANNPQFCRQMCLNRSTCMAFTYRPADGACWLKKGQPNPVEDSAYVSGVVRPDTQGPRISFVQATQNCSYQAKVQAGITDPSMVGRVELRTYNEQTGGPWQSKPMVLNQSTGLYEAGFLLPNSPYRVFYMVRAYDIHQNQSQSIQYSISYIIC